MRHITDEISSLTFALHFCFVPEGTGRARASVSHGDTGSRDRPVPREWAKNSNDDPSPALQSGLEAFFSKKKTPP